MSTTLLALLVGAICVMFNFWRLGSSGVVHRVVDGDSLEVNFDGRLIKVRLSNIDAPEWNQAHGRASRAKLAALAPVGTRVQLGLTRRDCYGRRVARVSVCGKDLGCEMARVGLAHGRGYRTTALAGYAAARRLGLWQDPRPIHPALWRGRRMSGSAVATIRA